MLLQVQKILLRNEIRINDNKNNKISIVIYVKIYTEHSDLKRKHMQL